ncbi:MAG TPA: heme-binding protein [Candidatus Limnocylindrales bacterium]|nr:heme-binding protein [Candidatus Limnocylindrales bacterium]
MRAIPSIDQAEAHRLLDRGLELARSDGGKPVVIALTDHAGDLMAFSRMDGAPVRSIRLAINKAYTAARVLATTQDLAARLREAGRDVLVYTDPAFTLFPGGTPVWHGGPVIGAVGISGRSAEDDQGLADRIAAAL